MRWRWSRLAGRIAAAFLLLLVVAVAALGVRWQSLADLARSIEARDRADDLVQRLERLEAELAEAEEWHRGYLITEEPSYLVPYRRALTDAARHLRELRTLTGDPRVERIDELMAVRVTLLTRALEARRESGFNTARTAASVEEGRRILDQIREAIGAIVGEERRRLAEHEASQRRRLDRTRAMLLGLGGLVVGGLVGLGVFVVVSVDRHLAARTRAEAEVRRQAERLRGLHELDRAILAADSPGRLAELALARLGTLVGGVRTGAVTVVDILRDEATVLASMGEAGASLGPGTRFALAPTGYREALRTAPVGTTEDLGPVGHRPVADALRGAEAQTWLLAPLVSGGEPVGVMVLGLAPSATPGPSDTEALAEVAAQMAVGLQQARFREEIVRRATELEERVTERTAELAAANRELEAFSYSVSHDLRAPLRAVSGFARLLVETHAAQLPAEAARYLGLVRDSADRMGRLIDDLLAFARLGRTPLRTRPVQPAALVTEALEELEPLREGRAVEVVVGELPGCEGDPALLRQVWVNLLGNALKFTRRRDAARVEVGARAENGEVAYFVRDNGAGFDMRYAGKLFGVFQRLHRIDEFEGTGAGLAIVHRVVHRHGGRVWAEGEVDRGATFFFTLGRGPRPS